MTPQEVIKTFVATLANRNYTYSTNVGKDMLDAAVKASTRFLSVQNAIDSMKADQVEAEREAVEEILGSDYAGKSLSDVASKIQKADVRSYATPEFLYYLGSTTTTVANAIKERKAQIFLEKYCGIQLATTYGLDSKGNLIYRGTSSTGNVDTGAITGSDANITLKADDIVYGSTLSAANLLEFANNDGMSVSGDALIIGTGSEKTARSVVPEVGNKYTASGSTAQNISTGSNDWIVTATSGNDTITTGGADSIDSGAGNDRILVGADHASILTGSGSDSVSIGASVNNVTLRDLTSTDTVTVGGNFSVGAAQVEDDILVVTDKSGNRTIRIANYADAKSAKFNSVTLANWLSNAGFDINKLATVSSSVSDETFTLSSALTEDDLDESLSQIAPDDDYAPAPDVNADSAETQNIGSASPVNLDNVTIESGSVTAGTTTLGTISNEFPNVSSFTKNGLTINLLGVATDTAGTPSKIQAKTLDELTDDQKTIIAGLFKWWAKESIKLNEESYDIGFDTDNSTTKTIGLFFYDSKGKGNTLAAVWNAGGSKPYLSINMHYYEGVSADNVDGESDSGYLDRTLAHEFNHAVLGANVSYFSTLPQFIKEGMAELTHGIDDFRSTRIFEVAYDASRLNKVLNVKDTGTGTADAYAGGYMFLRYLAKQGSLQLLVDYANPEAGESWTISSKNVATYTVDGQVVATISGLKSGLVAKGTSIDGITVKDGVITLSQKVLGTSKVTLTSDNYVLALGDDLKDNQVTVSNKAWTVSKGTATLKGDTTAGYSLSVDGKIINYSASKTKQTLATVSGLAKVGISASDFSTDGNVITLRNSMLNASKVTLKGDDYTLTLAGDVNHPTMLDPYWGVSKTTATYKYDTTAGYTLSEDAKTVAYSKLASTTLATVSGLKSGLKADGGTVDGISVNGTLITLGAQVLGTSTVKVKGGNYTLALGEGVSEPGTATPFWAVSGTGALYRQGTSAGYTLSEDEKTATYVKAVPETLATVSGLKKGLKAVDGAIDGITLDGDTITLGSQVLGTTKVKVSGGDYNLALADVAQPATVAPYWTVSGTTATYKNGNTAGFTLADDQKSANYTKATANTLATVTGLKKGLKVVDGSIDGISVNDTRIALNADVLGTSNVKVKGGDYTISLGVGTEPVEGLPYWSVSGTTATYKFDTSAGFTPSSDGKTANYSKKYSTVLATVSGLKKGLAAVEGKIDGISLSGEVITLGNNVLGTTKVSLGKKDNYTLALNGVSEPTDDKPYWTVKGTTATYKVDTKAGYTLASDYKSVNYTKNATSTVTTISGLKSGLKAIDGKVDGITLGADNVITLSADVLGTSKVTVKGGAYTLALADVAQPNDDDPYWDVKGTTAYYKYDTSAGFTLSEDAKTANYTKDHSTVTATISGLKSGLKAVNGAIDGITLGEDNVITLDAKVLGTSKVTVKGGAYTLALADVAQPNDGDPYWDVKGTTAYYKYNTSAGFTLSEDAKTANYTKDHSTVTATISGLKSGLKAVNGAIDGITLGEDNVITLSSNVLGTSKVSLGKKEPYTLAFTDLASPIDGDPYWEVKGATAYYKYNTSAGFTPNKDGKSANYIKETSTTLATVTGIKKGLEAVDGKIDGITLDDDNVITLDAKVLGTSKVTVKGGTYKLALADDLKEPKTEDRWSANKTTATYDTVRTAYFTPSGDGKTLNYNKESVLKNHVTVSGLASDAAVGEDGNVAGITLDAENKRVTLSGADNFGKKVEVKLAEDYILDNQLTAVSVDKTYWNVSNGTATLKQDLSAGYTSSVKNGTTTLTYSAAKSGKSAATVTTVTGLNKYLTAEDSAMSGLVYNLTDKTITLDNRVVGTSNIAVTNDYTLAPVTSGTYAIPSETKNDTIWAVDGTKATYKNVDIGYFTKNGDKALTYTKEKVHATYATISGLKTNAPLDSISMEGDVITLTSDALADNPTASTKVSLGKNDAYTLALGGGVAAVEYGTPAWSYSSGKATYTSDVQTAGYALANDSKSMTYTPVLVNKKPVTKTFATLSGVKSVNGISVDGKVIEISEEALNAKKVTLSTEDGYTLALGKDVEVPGLAATEWTTGSTTSSLKANVSAGYELTNDKTVTYYKGTSTTKAVVKGLADKNTILDAVGLSDDEIILHGNQLGSKVTVSGEYKFNFTDNYNDAAITASSDNDTITCAGSGLSITGGKGDDIINLGAGSGNVVIYAAGDGNDVIADFTVNDKIKVTKGEVIVDSSGSDVLITVQSKNITGTLTLSGVAGQNISVIDSSGVERNFPTTASEDLLSSDNFISLDAHLDSITDKDSLGELKAAQVLDSDDDFKTLDKQSTLVTYGKDK